MLGCMVVVYNIIQSPSSQNTVMNLRVYQEQEIPCEVCDTFSGLSNVICRKSLNLLHTRNYLYLLTTILTFLFQCLII
jgi:hypothetical protein